MTKHRAPVATSSLPTSLRLSEMRVPTLLFHENGLGVIFVILIYNPQISQMHTKDTV